LLSNKIISHWYEHLLRTAGSLSDSLKSDKPSIARVCHQSYSLRQDATPRFGDVRGIKWPWHIEQLEVIIFA
jgi:hypothetical protein